jgi:predicted nucleic acid-binding Zn ribbon protein
MAKRERMDRPASVKELLQRFLKPGDWQSLEQRRLIREVWEKVVPRSLLAHTRLMDVRRRELWVEVSASPWVQELQFLKPKILQELDRILGPGVIREVRFSVGARGK